MCLLHGNYHKLVQAKLNMEGLGLIKSVISKQVNFKSVPEICEMEVREYFTK